MTETPLDPRIGLLASGRHYAYPQGHAAEPVIGTREEVEAALGLRIAAPASKPARSPGGRAKDAPAPLRRFRVVVRFEYPAWDLHEGIAYEGIEAVSRAEANAIVRRRARDDGHLGVGQGRAWLTATEEE
ncbi:hypothetical protein J2T57_001434 [Natronocella acetinitrilica]|uniref:Uncharacterized protein n=1 Tax=Natronocella acetinitrilica TaxID=414046 RepID=A0AAE3KFQ7_9GAMM|nr:hypothetical protein [Natronocella acetinitrilica]MCP1674332.1 hypothetical protein [Natronocella acetinitrilica]